LNHHGPTLAQAKTKSRRAALQALYQWNLGQQPLLEIERWFLEEQDLRGADLKHFRDLLYQIPKNSQELDNAILGLAERELNNIDTVEMTALRIGAYELIYRTDIPYRVAIDEALELVKRFGAPEGHRFVNGVLNLLATRLQRISVG